MLHTASGLGLLAVALLLLFCQRVVAMAFLTDDRSHSALPDHIVFRLVAGIKKQRLAFVFLLNEGLDDIGVMDACIRSDVFLDKLGLLSALAWSL